MQSTWKFMVVTGAVAAAAAVACGELVLDIRIPRATLVEIHAIATNVSVLTADYRQVVETSKNKYGPEAETVIESPPPRFVVRVGGKVVEESKAGSVSDARGLFVIGPPGRVESIFTFRIDPRTQPKWGTVGEPGVQYLKNRYGNKLPAKYLQFSDRDSVTDRCITITATDLGLPGRLLRLQSGAFCVVFWKGSSPGSMLIGVTLGDGDPWMRPFSRRICRWLTTVALARLVASDGKPPPEYAGCLLVDRPNRSGTAEALNQHVYEVHRDSTLAYVN
jgi:hypothetical protein